MNHFRMLFTAVAGVAIACAAALAPAAADIPGPHPAYLHGLHDLRVAHALLDHSGNYRVDGQEMRALRDIDVAYRDARQAAIWDGKDLRNYEPIDANLRHRERIVRAIAALDAAHRDFAFYESNGADRGWQHATIVLVDRARAHARAALRDQRWDYGY